MSESATSKEKKSKAEIEQLVKLHGGKIFQTENAAKNTWVIGDRSKNPYFQVSNIRSPSPDVENVKISALKKKGTHDIIRPAWIFDCIRQHETEQEKGEGGGYVLPLEPG